MRQSVQSTQELIEFSHICIPESLAHSRLKNRSSLWTQKIHPLLYFSRILWSYSFNRELRHWVFELIIRNNQLLLLHFTFMFASYCCCCTSHLRLMMLILICSFCQILVQVFCTVIYCLNNIFFTQKQQSLSMICDMGNSKHLTKYE